MAELYEYLARYMPIKKMLISLAVGMVSFFIVLISGLTSEFVRSGTVASRTFSAFCFTSLWSFVFIMAGEEYAIFKSKRELENFIDSAQIEENDEDFNRDEYLGIKEDEVTAADIIENDADKVDDLRQLDLNRA